MKTLTIENARETFFTSKEHYLHFRDSWSHATKNSNNLNSAHYLVYALLRGKNAMEGFTPVTSHNKLLNGHYINGGLYEARRTLEVVAEYARKYHNTLSSYSECANDFLKPFGGTVTPETIIKLNELCPRIELLESNFGKGSRVAKEIIANNLKPTATELMNMYWEMV